MSGFNIGFLWVGILCLVNGFGEPEVTSPKVLLNGVPQNVTLKIDEGVSSVHVQGIGLKSVEEGKVTLEKFSGKSPIVLTYNSQTFSVKIKSIPGWLSLLPPLIAIILAFLWKDVLFSLLVGLLSGVMLLNNFNPFVSVLNLFEDRFINELVDSGHLKILIFTLSVSALVGLIRKSGALEDLINRMSKLVSTPRSGMLSTWLMGLVVFFDDYANSLLVGNTMRPFTDKLGISREKLSYIVDSTAAPVASLGLSTWIGYQISLMQDSFADIDTKVNGFQLFLNSWPYSFYSIFTLIFVFVICYTNKDFGPMSKAELRTRKTGKVLADDARPMQEEVKLRSVDAADRKSYWFAAIPLLVMVITTVVMMYYTGGKSVGFDKPLRDILGDASTTSSLMMGPIVGIMAFFLMSIRSVNWRDLSETLVEGSKSVLLAVYILTLAWSMATLCKDIQTSNYIVSVLGESLSPGIMPLVIFIIAGIIAFSTGTSWGTMAILFPIAVPLVHQVLIMNGLPADGSQPVLLASMAAILTGSVLGDHTSPISDTTLFSSVACGADHIHHVKTQIPYALVVGGVSIVFGYLPLALGIHWSVSLVLGVPALYGLVHFMGKKNVA